MASLETIIKKISNLSLLEKIMYILVVLLLICVIYNFFNKNRNIIEGFEQKQSFVLMKDDDIYDDFYADLYDILEYNKIHNQFEIGNIIDTTHPNEKSVILDVGSGTGHHVRQMANLTKNVIGVDYSSSMINKAIKNYPNLHFINDDILNNVLFDTNHFTHILCLGKQLYYMQNKKMFLENCYNWLMPGGYLSLKLMDKNSIKPLDTIRTIKRNVLPSFVDPELLLDTSIKFKDFIYKPGFEEISDSISVFKETFKYNNGNIRQNEHQIYMQDKDTIIKMAQYIGFIVLKVYDMKECEQKCPKNYIYILQKPN